MRYNNNTAMKQMKEDLKKQIQKDVIKESKRYESVGKQVLKEVVDQGIESWFNQFGKNKYGKDSKRTAAMKGAFSYSCRGKWVNRGSLYKIHIESLLKVKDYSPRPESLSRQIEGGKYGKKHLYHLRSLGLDDSLRTKDDRLGWHIDDRKFVIDLQWNKGILGLPTYVAKHSGYAWSQGRKRYFYKGDTVPAWEKEVNMYMKVKHMVNSNNGPFTIRARLRKYLGDPTTVN